MNYNSFDKEPKININLYDKEKPFKLLNNVSYLAGKYSGKEIYRICINKGYTWNGANIPRVFWRIIGSKYDPQFLPASLVHDWLCEHKDFIIQGGVRISSEIFKDILVMYGVPKCKANIMATCVKIYQYTQKGWN